MTTVDYNLDNMLKCICCKCKVQTKSICAKIKTEKIQKIEAKGLEAIPLVEPKEFPWLYCATGKALCNDLNFSEKCKCPDCKVWKENNLNDAEPMEFYCRDCESQE